MSMCSIALEGRAVFWVCALVLFVTAVGCTGQEPTLVQDGQGGVVEAAGRVAGGQGLESDTSGGSVGAEVEQNLAFPVLVPAFGLEANTTECKFTDDPYSTCI